MSWDAVVQIVSSGFGLFGLKLLYDLVREFRNFKDETKRDISSLRTERDAFRLAIKEADLNLKGHVLQMDEVFQKSMASAKTLHERQKKAENDIQVIKLRLDRVTVKAER
jgi:hypothetical protein